MRTSAGEIQIYIRKINRARWNQFVQKVPRAMSNKDIIEAIMEEVITGRMYFTDRKTIGVRVI